MENIDLQTLIDYYDGRLDERQMQQVAAWLAARPDDATARWLQGFTLLRERLRFVPLSQAARENLTAQFSVRYPSRWRRFVAALSFDSLRDAPAAQTRAQQLRGRQLQFDSEPLTLSLDIMETAQGFTLDGQLLFTEDFAPCSVQLLLDEREVALVNCDQVGTFVIDSLTAADYRLVVSADSYEVSVDRLTLA